MTYTQLIAYISLWIRENHNREITGNILQDVLIELTSYVKDHDDNIINDISELRNLIDSIGIDAGIKRILGDYNPNVTDPSETFERGDLFVNTSNDNVYIFTGSEWFHINRDLTVNANVREIYIDEDLDGSGVADYLSSMHPIQKTPNETWVIRTSGGAKYILTGIGSGYIGEGQFQIDEDNLFYIGGDTFDPSTTDLDEFLNESENPFVREEDLPKTLEGYHETGTKADGNLEILLGDWNDSGDGDKIKFSPDQNKLLQLINKLGLNSIEIEREGTDWYNLNFRGADGKISVIISGDGSIYAGMVNIRKTANIQSQLDAQLLTETRTHKLPDRDGIIALVDDIPPEYTIPDKAVTNSKLADVPTKTIKGRTASGTGVPKDLTVAEVLAMLNVESGAQKNVKSDWTAETGTPAEILNKPSQVNFNIYNQNKTDKVVVSNTTKTSIIKATTGSKNVPSYNLNDSFIGKVFGFFDSGGASRTIEVFFKIGNREGSISTTARTYAESGAIPFSIEYKIDFPTARLSSITGVVRVGNESKVIDLDFAIITGLDFDMSATLNGGSLTINSSYLHRNYN